MKFFLSILTIVVFLNFTFVKAQNKPIGKIKTATRYKDNSVELRFFPDRKKILDYGLKSGFIIERSNGSSTNFVEIARTKPYTKEQWSELLQKTTDKEAQIQIEISQDFYLASLEKSGGNLDFTEGIANLKQQKANEDFKFMVSILTAIKNANASKGLGLTYTDTNVQAGKEYSYRVKLIENPPVYQIESVLTTVKTILNTDDYKNKVYIKTGDTKLGFVWKDHPKLSGVDVERTINGINTKLNKAPIYTIRGKGYKGVKRNGFSEDSLVNYKKYTYRFYAHTVFGERVKFAEVTGMPRDLTPPQKPFLKQPKHTKPDEVHIEWEMKKPISKDFKGFSI